MLISVMVIIQSSLSILLVTVCGIRFAAKPLLINLLSVAAVVPERVGHVDFVASVVALVISVLF